MRLWLTWLLALGVFAGLHARVLASDPCETLARSHHHCHGEENDSHPCHEEPGDSDHDKQCPAEHHHHHGCVCPVMPLIPNSEPQVRLGCHSSRLGRCVEERQRIPEGPVLGMDKPPLV